MTDRTIDGNSHDWNDALQAVVLYLFRLLLFLGVFALIVYEIL